METMETIRKENQKDRRNSLAVTLGLVMIGLSVIGLALFTIGKAAKPYQEYEITVSDDNGIAFSCSDCYVESVKYNFEEGNDRDILCPTHCPLTVTLNTGEVIEGSSVALNYDRGNILCPTHCPLIMTESKRLWHSNNK